MAKKKSRAGVENKKPNSNSPTQKKKGANQNQGGEQKARAVTEQVRREWRHFDPVLTIQGLDTKIIACVTV